MTTAWRLRERAGFAIGEFGDAHGALAADEHVEGAEDGMERAEHQQAVEQDEDRQQREVGFLETHAPEQVGKPQAGGEVDDHHAAEKDDAAARRCAKRLKNGLPDRGVMDRGFPSVEEDEPGGQSGDDSRSSR